MKKLTDKFELVIVVLCILHCSTAEADYPKEIEIISKYKQINVGQPLILRLTYKFEQPQLSASSGEILMSVDPRANVQVKKNDKEISRPGHWYLGLYDLYLQDKEGLTYSGDFILFYDLFKKGLIFDTPGIYKIEVRRTREIISKPLEITFSRYRNQKRRCFLYFQTRTIMLSFHTGETSILKNVQKEYRI